MLGRILGTETVEIRTFISSSEALEKAIEERPEVIFLDIIMPELDGIEFTERIKAVYSPEIIIISGNDDYHYVRQSFKLNVTDYILKPVEYDELKRLSLRFKEKLESPGYAPVLLPERLPFFFVLAVKGEGITRECIAKISQIAESRSLVGTVKCKVSHERFHEVSFSFYAEKESDYAVCVQEFEQLFHAFASRQSAVWKAAYSRQVPIEESDRAKREVELLLQNRLYSEERACYSPDSMIRRESADHGAFFERLSVLPQLISYDDVPVYSEFIDTWFVPERLGKLSFEEISHEYDAVLRKITNDGKYEENVAIRNFGEMNTIGEVIAEIKRVFETFTEFYLESSQSDKTVIERALSFIDKNYHKDITLATVSNYYNLNYSYFSRIFKKWIGISFTQYLLNIRMEKAKELLASDPELKIGDVARQVGYNVENVQNFTRAFKKHFGKSPKNYKSND